MATSNALGALNFELLICLGGPWLVTTLIAPDNVVDVDEDFNVAFCILITAAIVDMFIMFFAQWRIPVKLGISFIVMYIAFLFTATGIQGTYAEDAECLGETLDSIHKSWLS